MAGDTEIRDVLQALREEVGEHTLTLEQTKAAYVAHGYLLALELVAKRLRDTRRQVA